MTPERWAEIKRVYTDALEREGPERDSFLDRACGSDTELRREVESLLRESADSSEFQSPVSKPDWIGRNISHYHITEKLGEGGMGVVYRASDTRLNREVALKILPEQFAGDPERMVRFGREARLLASLNHLNIAAIHGLEEADGVRALAMELVEGPTLADRVSKGAIPLKEALPLAEQIAAALEYAHEHGVIHRDLKPANVKVTEDGTVKVLDFGLAKAMEAPTPGGDPTDSPTLTEGATKEGTILGTAAYMAPEQALGKRVDKRADIWAFGVVLYEMLTGTRLFRGETLTETLASVVKEQPDLSAVPPQVQWLLEKCLEKDPKKRLRDIGDLWALLEEEPLPQRPGSERTRFGWLLWAVATVATIALLALAFVFFRQAPPELPAVQFSMESPPDTTFSGLTTGYAASPNGRYVVLTARDEEDDTSSLWLRPLDSQTARRLAGTEGGSSPTWSPDGRSLAFYADGQLKRIEITGGPVLPLGEATPSPVSVAGTWNHEGVILFGSAAGLQRVSASGGGATLLTEVDPAQQETGHGYPQFLPDGDRFLYFVASGDPNVQGVYASSLSDPGRRSLIVRTAAKAVYIPPRAAYPGYLLWLQGQTLVARRFDLDTLQFEGVTATVAEGIALQPVYPARAAFWASEGGLLTYFTEGMFALKRIVWMSRDGVALEEVALDDTYSRLALAPDGERMAVSITETGVASGQFNTDIWVRELASGRMTKLTFDPASDDYPVWSPKGTAVAFSSSREGGEFQIYRKDASGAGRAERLTEGPNRKEVYDWSRDGRYLLYAEVNPETSDDVMALPLEGDRTPFPVVQTRFREDYPAISPDGRWVAYHADYSGRLEIYVQAFPGADDVPQGRWLISNNGGISPQWRDDGEGLYFSSLDGDLMAVRIKAGPLGVRAETPRELLTGLRLRTGLSMQFDFTPDGERFLLILPSAQQPERQRLTVVSNWQATLGQ